ncbi:hypothetical protein GCM10010309_13300 [Streptomyces violaceochromogenes]|nr:hypothetical protein GCM10010309_13300 [Streptomyces violaceochromogenes]
MELLRRGFRAFGAETGDMVEQRGHGFDGTHPLRRNGCVRGPDETPQFGVEWKRSLGVPHRGGELQDPPHRTIDEETCGVHYQAVTVFIATNMNHERTLRSTKD